MTAGPRAQADEDVELRRLARLASGGRARPASSARRAAQGRAAADFDSFVYTRRRCARARPRLSRGGGPRSRESQRDGLLYLREVFERSICGRSLSAPHPRFVRRPFSSARLRAALTLLPTARSGGATPGAPASPLGQVVRSKGFVWSDRFPRTALLWHARALPWRTPHGGGARLSVSSDSRHFSQPWGGRNFSQPWGGRAQGPRGPLVLLA